MDNIAGRTVRRLADFSEQRNFIVPLLKQNWAGT